MVNVTWRDPKQVGSPAGYADTGPPTVDAFQTIRLGIALPLNTNTGDAAWGGRLVMTAGGVATRVGYRVEGNHTVRVAKKGGETLDKK